MNCHVSKGDMPIQIQWFQNGEPTASNTGITVQKLGQRSSVLTISNVRAEHRGVFMCSAKNNAGTSNFTVQVHVKGIFLKVVLKSLTFLNPFPVDIFLLIMDISFRCQLSFIFILYPTYGFILSFLSFTRSTSYFYWKSNIYTSI